MSGYTGNPDAEAEHAQIMSDNGIELARSMLPKGESAFACHDCGEPIPQARREAQKGCKYCIDCQPNHDKLPLIKMITKML